MTKNTVAPRHSRQRGMSTTHIEYWIRQLKPYLFGMRSDRRLKSWTTGILYSPYSLLLIKARNTSLCYFVNFFVPVFKCSIHFYDKNDKMIWGFILMPKFMITSLISSQDCAARTPHATKLYSQVKSMCSSDLEWSICHESDVECMKIPMEKFLKKWLFFDQIGSKKFFLFFR